jgi:CO/xanthine dehydrogenase Mo-binding subunit
MMLTPNPDRQFRRLPVAGVDRHAADRHPAFAHALPLNPLGMGAGEGGTIPAIAAIIAAVENALAPFGVKINEAPISPARIVELLRMAR